MDKAEVKAIVESRFCELGAERVEFDLMPYDISGQEILEYVDELLQH